MELGGVAAVVRMLALRGGGGGGGWGVLIEPDDTQPIGDRLIRRSCGRLDSSLLSASTFSTLSPLTAAADAVIGGKSTIDFHFDFIIINDNGEIRWMFGDVYERR